MADRREISWEEYGRLARDLGMAVYARKPDVVVGIARGGAVVACTLSFQLGVEFYPVRLRREGGAHRVVVGPSPELAGKHVALVDDLSESGDTFRIARHELAQVGVTEVTTVALVRRVPGYATDIWALEVSGKVRFPWNAERIVDGHFEKWA